MLVIPVVTFLRPPKRLPRPLLSPKLPRPPKPLGKRLKLKSSKPSPLPPKSSKKVLEKPAPPPSVTILRRSKLPSLPLCLLPLHLVVHLYLYKCRENPPLQ